VAALPCGERFTILVYGFVFSRIQTGDGKIGYVYSNVIAVDRSGASVQQTSSPRMVSASEKTAIKTSPAPAAQPKPQAPRTSSVRVGTASHASSARPGANARARIAHDYITRNGIARIVIQCSRSSRGRRTADSGSACPTCAARSACGCATSTGISSTSRGACSRTQFAHSFRKCPGSNSSRCAA